MTETMTAAEYRALPKRKHKYGAKTAYRCKPCGGVANKRCCAVCRSQDVIKFASKAEARHYDVLRARQDRGEIRALELQPVYPIYLKGKKICKVVLDFAYLEGDASCETLVDVKGHDNALSRLKRRLVEAAYGIEVQVIK